MRHWFVVLLLVALLGCAGGVTRHGVFGSFGQSNISTCTEGEPADCTVITGAAISVPGMQLLGGLVGAVAKFFGLSLPEPEPEPAE